MVLCPALRSVFCVDNHSERCMIHKVFPNRVDSLIQEQGDTDPSHHNNSIQNGREVTVQKCKSILLKKCSAIP